MGATASSRSPQVEKGMGLHQKAELETDTIRKVRLYRQAVDCFETGEDDTTEMAAVEKNDLPAFVALFLRRTFAVVCYVKFNNLRHDSDWHANELLTQLRSACQSVKHLDDQAQSVSSPRGLDYVFVSNITGFMLKILDGGITDLVELEKSVTTLMFFFQCLLGTADNRTALIWGMKAACNLLQMLIQENVKRCLDLIRASLSDLDRTLRLKPPDYVGRVVMFAMKYLHIRLYKYYSDKDVRLALYNLMKAAEHSAPVKVSSSSTADVPISEDQRHKYDQHLKLAQQALTEGNLKEAENHFADAIRQVHRCQESWDLLPDPIRGMMYTYKEKSIRSKSIKGLLKSIGLANSLISLLATEENKNEIREVAKHLEALVLSFIHPSITCTHLQQYDKSNREKVNTIRKTCHERLNNMKAFEQLSNQNEETVFISEVRSLCSWISDEMGGFLSMLYKQAEEMLQVEQTTNTLLAFGSLGWGVSTPYSDYEFGFLIETEVDEIIEKMFHITHAMHIRVLNLGETILPILDIKSLSDQYSANPESQWFYDKGPRGVSFDGAAPHASKVPTGREATAKKPTPKHLIHTPKVLAEFQMDVEKEKPAQEGYKLAQVVRHFRYICGDEVLRDEYVNELDSLPLVESGLAHLSLMQKDALKILTEEIAEKRSNPLRLNRDMGCNVKYDLYRLPSLLIETLSALYGIKASTPWDVVQEMWERGYIKNETAVHNLNLMLSISNYMRQKMYMRISRQDENLFMEANPTPENMADLYLIVRFYQVYMAVAYSVDDMCVALETKAVEDVPFVSEEDELKETSGLTLIIPFTQLTGVRLDEYLLTDSVSPRKQKLTSPLLRDDLSFTTTHKISDYNDILPLIAQYDNAIANTSDKAEKLNYLEKETALISKQIFMDRIECLMVYRLLEEKYEAMAELHEDVYKKKDCLKQAQDASVTQGQYHRDIGDCHYKIAQQEPEDVCKVYHYSQAIAKYSKIENDTNLMEEVNCRQALATLTAQLAEYEQEDGIESETEKVARSERAKNTSKEILIEPPLD